MKKFGILLVAAILGSTLTIGTTQLLNLNKKNIKIEHVSQTPVAGAVYTLNKEGEVVPLEFRSASKKVMDAVVHIKSTKMLQTRHYYQPYENSDPFRRFFDDEVFREFFGPNFKFESPQQQKNAPQTQVGSGSGVIINSEGYIVTNNHVIHEADDIEVSLHDNRVYKAKVIGVDPSTDLALLQIKEKNLPALPLVNSDDVEVGEWVLAVGNPFNLNSTVTAGIVSAKARNINILQDKSAIESFIQTDAAINPGNSGGALVDLQGGLIGINTAIASPTGAYTGYGFAIPSNIVNKVIEDLLKFGIVQRGYLGLMIRSVDGNLAKEKDLELTKGVFVDSITLNSAAGDAGIKTGDIILEIDGKKTNTSAELMEIIGRHRPGDKIDVKVNRNGSLHNYNITLKNQEGKTGPFNKVNKNILDNLGIKALEIDAKTAKKLGINGGIKLTEIKKGKLKNQTNIRNGFIITKVDGKEVSSVDALKKILENKKSGGVMIEGIYEDFPGTYYYAFGL
jgi:Do/DeqQ family serine protease